MKIRRANSKGSATSSAKFSCASHCDPFLEKTERTARSFFKGSKKGLSVRGAVMHIGNKGRFENDLV